MCVRGGGVCVWGSLLNVRRKKHSGSKYCFFLFDMDHLVQQAYRQFLACDRARRSASCPTGCSRTAARDGVCVSEILWREQHNLPFCAAFVRHVWQRASELNKLGEVAALGPKEREERLSCTFFMEEILKHHMTQLKHAETVAKCEHRIAALREQPELTADAKVAIGKLEALKVQATVQAEQDYRSWKKRRQGGSGVATAAYVAGAALVLGAAAAALTSSAGGQGQPPIEAQATTTASRGQTELLRGLITEYHNIETFPSLDADLKRRAMARIRKNIVDAFMRGSWLVNKRHEAVFARLRASDDCALLDIPCHWNASAAFEQRVSEIIRLFEDGHLREA
jgi:hypothetical protein